MESISDAGFNSLLNSNTPFAVLFTAPWCKYCPATKEAFEQALAENPDLPKVYVADVEKDCAELASRFGVMGIPVAMAWGPEGNEKPIASLSGQQAVNAVAQWLQWSVMDTKGTLQGL